MRNVYLFIALLCCIGANAQTPADAALFSQTFFGGTARGMAVAGAFGALGADYQSMNVNPAGLGQYRKSEMMITPSLYFTNSDARYLNEIRSDDFNNLNFNNIGVVFSNNLNARANASGWKYLTLAVGLNKTANFNDRVFYSGFNETNSMGNAFVQNANGTHWEDLSSTSATAFFSGLAFQTYVLNPTSDNTYASLTDSARVQQDQLLTTDGANHDIAFGVGTNYKDQLYLGASIGIPFINFERVRTYTETDVDGLYPAFDNFTLTDVLSTSAYGFNFKFGLGYRINQYLRLGVAFHTPTFYRLDDTYSSSMTALASSDLENPNLENFEFEQSDLINYDLRTPYKVVASAAVFFKKYGFLSIDYEWLDYGSSKFSFDDTVTDNPDDFVVFENELNQLVDNQYKGAHNIRAGVEFAIDMFRLRGGYAYYGNPLRNNAGLDATTAITGGFGFRVNQISIDFAYVRTQSNYTNSPYLLLGEEPVATIDRQTHNGVLTVAYRFDR